MEVSYRQSRDECDSVGRGLLLLRRTPFAAGCTEERRLIVPMLGSHQIRDHFGLVDPIASWLKVIDLLDGKEIRCELRKESREATLQRLTRRTPIDQGTTIEEVPRGHSKSGR